MPDSSAITTRVFRPGEIPESEVLLLPVRSLSYSKVAADGTVLVQHDITINELAGTVDEYRFERERVGRSRSNSVARHGSDVLTAIAFFSVVFGLLWGGFYLTGQGLHYLLNRQSALTQEVRDA